MEEVLGTGPGPGSSARPRDLRGCPAGRPLPHLQGLLAELNHLREDVWLPAGCDVCPSISAVLLFTQDVRELFFFLGEISLIEKKDVHSIWDFHFIIEGKKKKMDASYSVQNGTFSRQTLRHRLQGS